MPRGLRSTRPRQSPPSKSPTLWAALALPAPRVHRHSTLLILLLTLAFGLRALLPQGFMWAGADADFALAFCSPSGQNHAQVFDAEQGRFVLADSKTEDSEPSQDEPCPFGVTPALMQTMAALPAVEQRPDATRPSLLRARHARLQALPPLPARGPPMTA